jgi:hypothetical protein
MASWQRKAIRHSQRGMSMVNRITGKLHIRDSSLSGRETPAAAVLPFPFAPTRLPSVRRLEAR